MKKTAKTIIIPPGCVERFVDFSDLAEGAGWFGEKIVMAASAHHVPGYLVNYPNPRKHNILYCRSGSYFFQYGPEKGVLRAGEVLVLPAGCCQHFRVQEAADNMFFLITPSERFADPAFTHKNAPNIELIGSLMAAALRERYASAPDNVIRRHVAPLIAALIRQDIAVREVEESPIDRLTAKLRHRPGTAWTVDEMAAEIGISASHLFAVCRSHCGMSPYELLTRIRLEFACRLLATTDYPVKAIAAQCGYELPFSFSRTFQKRHLVSPTRYRRQLQARKKAGNEARDVEP